MINRFIYDIEVYPNLFCVTFFDIQKNKSFLFSIHKKRNDLFELEKFLDQEITLIGYNNIFYDGVVLQYLLQNKNRNKNSNNITRDLFEFSSEIINSERGMLNYNIRKYQYPEDVKYNQIDLMKIIEISGIAPSLKQLAISLQWYRIQDLPYPYNYEIQTEEEEKLIYDYNLNDVLISNKYYEVLLPRIELREKLSEIYGVNLINSSNSKMADKILEKFYADELNADMKYIKTLRTNRQQFLLSECIAEDIVFETKYLNRIKSEISNTLVRKSTNYKYSKNINFGGIEYELGVGGLHSIDFPAKFIETNEWKIYDNDVASYYTSMMIKNKVMPKHLGEDFIKILTKLTKERVAAKKIDKIKAEGLKVTINSIFGKLGSDTFWLYDPLAMCSVTVSGQLYLLMLIEKLVLNEIMVISANTDGVVSRVNISQLDKFEEISKWWQQKTSFTLEKTEYKNYFRQDVNNYLTEKTDGEIKAKGRYVKEIVAEKGYKFPVVPLAMYNYAIKNISVEETIKNHKSILDFCISQKSGRDFQMEYHLSDTEIENLQKNNRFFISLNGGKLNKHHKQKGTNIGLYVGEKVRILNDYDSSLDITEYDLDYDFYIEEAKKYTENVEIFEKQLEPFIDENEDYILPTNIKKKEEFFFNYYMLKNISENFVNSLLYLEETFQGTTFCDFLIYAIETKNFSSKFEIMIKLNYFSRFGNQRKLLNFLNEFTKGPNKYTISLAEKTKEKRISLLKEYFEWMEEKDFSILDQISNESSVIGFPYSKYNVNKYYGFIKEINTKKSYHPTLKLHILYSGEEKELKINKLTIQQFPLSVNDVILCKSFSKKFRKTKNENNEWIETDIYDIYLDTYYKMKPSDKFHL